ncbi:TPA: hypothetical protein L9R77_002544 [Klebsiella pneumoniae]|jgi:hypothetical protein|uniref:hypothetical protein n=1 Tax=Klebsiella pneumoniae TaxID=573 RepID=UPI000E2BBB9A|nr:hypothetical protein [Klebsiella pneumoniae]EKV6274020.1 hypothetical protein [Klebsiella pneumoniae]ELA1607979.1 hypothetical protein [Klebsiella pneumoniae]ELA1696273.1 hypothetical protein [Klebsiella pneumoniae]MDU1898476.1 hypothetical protein [Klebsiella pneumoniae]MDU4490870.1 hypothetical protein [Klebsiella pneumoniae]
MTITEGLCADLYCDCDGCQSGKIYPQGQADFIGRNMTDISQQARKAGWRISKDRQRCYAPGHKISRGSNQ